MIRVPHNTVEGGLDWYGLTITENSNNLIVHEGRIGISDKPLLLEDGRVSGGYYFPETSITTNASDRSIDLLLCHTDETLYLLVRSEDMYEQYDGDIYRLILTLAVRQSEGSPWLVSTPQREMYENTYTK